MALNDNVVHFELFVERETMQAITTGYVSWYDPKDDHGYRCDGLDPGIFPCGEVPMKFSSPDHRIALKWFAHAVRAGIVSLPPTFLLMARMPALCFLEHCIRGDIVIHSKMSTCALKKPVNEKNYPGLVMEFIEFTEDEAQRMLEYATEHLL